MLTNETKEERKKELVEMIDKGIERMRENHMRHLAQVQVYSFYSLTDVMSAPWITMEDSDMEGQQYPLHLVAGLIDLPISLIFTGLTAKIDYRTQELLPNYTGGDFLKVLEKAREIGLRQIDEAVAGQEADHIISRTKRVIHECSESRPWLHAPELMKNGEILPGIILPI